MLQVAKFLLLLIMNTSRTSELSSRELQPVSCNDLYKGKSSAIVKAHAGMTRRNVLGALAAGALLWDPRKGWGSEASDRDEAWRNQKKGYENLLRLEHNSPEEVFGENYPKAFLSTAELARGNIKFCVTCIDERVPGPKIAVAGAGVLLSDIPDRNKQRGNDEDVLRPNADFYSLVARLQGLQKKGYQLEVSDHERCGAVEHYCKLFHDKLGRMLKPEQIAPKAAERLHKALGLQGHSKHAGFQKGDIRMTGKPSLHDGYAVVMDGSGRVDIDKLGIRGFLISERFDPSDDHIRTEAHFAADLIRGSHGLGIERVPHVLIGDPEDPENSVKALEAKLGDLIKDPKKAHVLRMNAPPQNK